MEKNDTDEISYEGNERLMSESQVRAICQVLDLSDNAINNYNPLPLPQMVGAGRVKPFREDQRRVPLRRLDRGNDEPTLGGDNLSEFSTIDDAAQPLPAAPKKQSWEDWPPIATYDEFEISPEEVKKRAAWGWYRTGIICAEGARISINDTDHNTANDGGERALLVKSEKAKAHALRLYAELLEQENIECPSWAEPLTTSDEAYYLEMERNQEYIKRVEMAEVYKNSARDYMMEALSPYLEWKQTQDIEATKTEPKEIYQYMSDVIKSDEFGCLSRLWDQAIEWMQTGDDHSANKQSESTFPSDDFKVSKSVLPRNFNYWWVRAARARGHAEWLLRERRVSGTMGHSTPIEPWRLLPPGTVEHYENSCLIWSILVDLRLREHGGWDLFYEHDLFGTHFNVLSETMRGSQSRDFGWPFYSYIYGAPDFVFRALNEDASGPTLIGILPVDVTSRCYGQAATSISVYPRYMRQGVFSTLHESSPESYRALAKCADNILAEWDAELALDGIIHPRYKSSRIFASLTSNLRSLLEKRIHMTLQETENTQFDDTVYSCIRSYMDGIQRMLRRPPGLNEHRYLIWVERQLSKQLAPWFDFHLEETRGGRIIIHIVSLLSRRRIVDPWTSEFLSIAEPVWLRYEASVIAALDDFLEDIRGLLLSNVWIPPHTYRFILVFREYLQSGGELGTMPVIKGTGGDRRELTKLGLYKSGRIKCKPGCKCPLPRLIEEMEERVRSRVSNSPQAQKERRAILDFFWLNSNFTTGPNCHLIGITPQRLELLERVRKKK